MPPRFNGLRTTSWEPTFDWYSSIRGAAYRINQHHEDYPRRVLRTQLAIEEFDNVLHHGILRPRSVELQKAHYTVFTSFQEHPGHAGKWRNVRVRVGSHHPPEPDSLPTWMERLEKEYAEDIKDIYDVIDWYIDFESIHPFEDGNGRVGGVIVAAFSNFWHPESGWMDGSESVKLDAIKIAETIRALTLVNSGDFSPEPILFRDELVDALANLAEGGSKTCDCGNVWTLLQSDHIPCLESCSSQFSRLEFECIAKGRNV